MCDTVVATPFSPGTASNSPMISAPANTSVMNPLRRLRRAFAAFTCCGWEGSTELTVHTSRRFAQTSERAWGCGSQDLSGAGELSSLDCGDFRLHTPRLCAGTSGGQTHRHQDSGH